MSAWKPGDVAAGSVDGFDDVRLMAGEGTSDPKLRWMTTDSRLADSTNEGWFFDFQAKDVRPLVVLDPEDIPVAKGALAPTWLRSLVRELHADDRTVSTSLENVLSFLADAIDATNAPPKPDEPTGLGAVVEDDEGRKWVNTHRVAAWVHQDRAEARKYAEVAAVRVLSEGVAGDEAVS